MALTQFELRNLKNSTSKQLIVKFRYYPQIIKGRPLNYSQNFRYCFAYAVFLIKGRNYFLGKFYKGASYSGASEFDYRLYKVSGMWELTIPKTVDGQVNLSKSLEIKENLKTIFLRKFYANDFEE